MRVEYLPSTMGKTESSEISFISEQIGKWQYAFAGVGLPPQKFETKVIAGQLE